MSENGLSHILVTVSHKVGVKMSAVAASPEGLAEVVEDLLPKMAPSQGRRSPYLALSLSRTAWVSKQTSFRASGQKQRDNAEDSVFP